MNNQQGTSLVKEVIEIVRLPTDLVLKPGKLNKLPPAQYESVTHLSKFLSTDSLGVVWKKTKDTISVVTRSGSVVQVPSFRRLDVVKTVPRVKPLTLQRFRILKGNSSLLNYNYYIDSMGGNRVGFCSPPYNICRDYSDFNDSTSVEEHTNLIIDVAVRYGETRGLRAWVLNVGSSKNYPEFHVDIAYMIRTRTQWKHFNYIFWKKPVAQPVKGSFKRTGEHIYIFGRTVRDTEPITPSYPWYLPFEWYPITENFVKTNVNNDRNRIQEMTKFGYHNDATCPEELVGRILATVCEPGDTVIDTFSGSGTTGEVCLKAGMNFLGIDISETACKWMKHKWMPKAEFKSVKDANNVSMGFSHKEKSWTTLGRSIKQENENTKKRSLEDETLLPNKRKPKLPCKFAQ